MKFSLSINKITRFAFWCSALSFGAIFATMAISSVLGLDWKLSTAVAFAAMLVQLCLLWLSLGDNAGRLLESLRDAGLISLDEPLPGAQRALQGIVSTGGSLLIDAPRALVERCLGRAISEDETLAAPIFAQGYSVPGDGSLSALLMKGGRVWHFRFNLGPGVFAPTFSGGFARELDADDMAQLRAALA